MFLLQYRWVTWILFLPCKAKKLFLLVIAVTVWKSLNHNSYFNSWIIPFFQVGLIILYDHVHPVGAFVKNSSIDVSTINEII